MKAHVTKKHVTPKWVDRLLISVLLAMPVFYIAGFNVNYGPSMFHLGWFYRTSWGERPTRVGQIVRFAPPDQPSWRKYLLPCIKRVAEIRKDGYFVEGDNTEHSQDSRDWNKDIPPDHIAGVVVWCWSPARMINALTATGRLKNRLALSYNPAWYCISDKLAAAWSPSEQSTSLYRNGCKVMSISGGWMPRIHPRTKGKLLLHRSVDLREEYKVFDGRLIGGLDENGLSLVEPECPETICLDNGSRIKGGLVSVFRRGEGYAPWRITATSHRITRSELVFAKPYTGTMTVRGGWGSGACLTIHADGVKATSAIPPWKEWKIPLSGVTRIEFQANKMVSEGLWVVRAVDFN